ncbi:MAG: hypothetical protein BGN82_06845 [Alphaproteobacteria bacterium 65-7]|nr:MAG: hypothetical protein BGN82_06845 [Alphaproteobacteria bacterium 65-7]
MAGRKFFVTIENFHGVMVAVYTGDGNGGWRRQVIDDGLLQGHALVLADIDDDGRPDLVCMDARKPNYIKWYSRSP